MRYVKDITGCLVVGLAVAVTPVMSNAAFIVQPGKDPAALFNGPYLGLDVGYSWLHTGYITNPGCPPFGMTSVFCGADPDPSVINGLEIAAIGSGSIKATGPSYGAHMGFNYQNGGLVVGGEVDFSSLDLDNGVTVSGQFPYVFLGDQYTLTESASMDWLATIRVRLGMAMDAGMLLYATTGAAFTELNGVATYSDNAISATFPGGYGMGSNLGRLSGWVYGLGAEWLVTESLAFRFEYLHVGLGSMDVLVPISNTLDYTQVMQVNFSPDADMLRVGLSYYI